MHPSLAWLTLSRAKEERERKQELEETVVKVQFSWKCRQRKILQLHRRKAQLKFDLARPEEEAGLHQVEAALIKEAMDNLHDSFDRQQEELEKRQAENSWLKKQQDSMLLGCTSGSKRSSRTLPSPSRKRKTFSRVSPKG